VTPPPATREPHPTDLFCVASAGNAGWRRELSPEELSLVGALVAVEERLREREWDALAIVLRHVEGTPPDDRLIPPSDAQARLELARAMVEIGWHREGANPGTLSP
jgi:hypothetical protein